ncbi:2-oxoglutarate-dependent dioxygenase 19-like [Salvia miltiorrhiza]|uniref:2-oxoglutarate-dependent dioxygenase 19-like n=1 Tax=Salvia miltiorrhiza TaxID=226208 RepID=UPI0025AB79DD|nr:2-oxoglutarate-dependent dioxygenase 19-like [Salvia miltiorrhiza]XP_057812537.1 2-oxoglutarate-dependent dioxygenase 19-like [Salvia miltiorrhiza]
MKLITSIYTSLTTPILTKLQGKKKEIKLKMASIVAASDSFKPFEFDATLKVIADSSSLKSVPSKFNFSNERTAFTSDSLPTVDFSALIAGDPHQRSKAVDDLAAACREWGFFILVNHGVPESLMEAMFIAVKEFFRLPDSEKKQFEAKSASDPIKCGNFNVANTSNQSFTLWRDYLKLYVHPNFHCPHQPQLLRDAVLEYTQITRKLATTLIEAVCEALELNQRYVDEILKMDSSFQMFATNYYPRCPQPDQAIGIPAHTDPGLFTFLIHNGVDGLQIEHDGKWFNADSPQNSILVNAADQLEIFTNGRCKSVKHRAVVNEERERISIVVANGPSGEAVVGPAAALVEKDGGAKYNAMKYEEYVESQLTKSRVDGKSLLEQQMIFINNSN